MKQFAQQFKSPFLKQAFELIEYSIPEIPWMMHLDKHANGAQKCIGWPVGGALELAKSVANYYKSLNGEIHYNSKAEKILYENGKAIGIKLADKTIVKGDIIISNADGRKTISNLLDNKFTNDYIKKLCQPLPDHTNWAVHVFLGVKRNMKNIPSELVLLLKDAVQIADHNYKSLELQAYGYDETMAPPGKGVLKVELFSSYSYWKKLYDQGKDAYNHEKIRVANQVIDILEKNGFEGISKDIEVIDVPTLITWERYMGDTMGFMNLPKVEFNFKNFLSGLFAIKNCNLPGLDHFYFVGNWTSGGGSLFGNAISGKKIIKMICKREGLKFYSQ